MSGNNKDIEGNKMKKVRIGLNRATLFQFLINSALGIIGFLFLTRENESVAFACLSCVQVFLNTYYMRKMKIRWFSLSMLFVWATFMFHFGNVWLIALGESQYCAWDIVALSNSIYEYNLSCLFSLFCSGFVVTGIMMSYVKNAVFYVEDATNLDHKKEKRMILYLGILLFVITVVPSVLLQWKRLQVVWNGGIYSQTRSVDNELGLFYFLTRFFPFSLVMIMLGIQDNKNKARIVYLIAVVYEAVCMISGNRSLQLIAIIMYTFVYVSVISRTRLKFKTKAIILITAYVAAAAINVLMKVRNFGLTQYDMSGLIVDAVKSNPLLPVIGEFGITQVTVSLVITNYPAFVPYKLGLSYLAGIFAWVLPITGSQWYKNATVFIYEFEFGSQLTLGGSYIGELFANFGWFGIVGAVFVGIFIGRICSRIFACIKSDNWSEFVPLLVLFYFNLFWVRNFFYGFVFTYVGMRVFIWVATQIVKKEKN